MAKLFSGETIPKDNMYAEAKLITTENISQNDRTILPTKPLL